MAKDNLRLISARIDEESYNKITAILNKHSYWNRNYIIRRILFVVLNDFDNDAIHDMIRKPYSTTLPFKSEYRWPYYVNDSKE